MRKRWPASTILAGVVAALPCSAAAEAALLPPGTIITAPGGVPMVLPDRRFLVERGDLDRCLAGQRERDEAAAALRVCRQTVRDYEDAAAPIPGYAYAGVVAAGALLLSGGFVLGYRAGSSGR